MQVLRTGAMILACAALAASCAAAPEAPPVTTVMIPGSDIFPESITATAAGDIIIAAAGTGAIYRAAPGESVATLWIDPESSGMVAMLGVFADERANRLYACSRPRRGETGPEADAASSLRIFALDTGAPLARYPMPGGAADICNDIAVDAAGAAYIAETYAGRIYKLAPGAAALEIWAEEPRFAGADGLAFDEDGSLVFNTVTTSRLFKIAPRADGGAGEVTELTPSLPLSRPDGLRALGDGRFIMAESGAGRVTVFTVEGAEARTRALGGVVGTTGVAFARGRVWAVNAKFAYRTNPALAGQDPGPFEAYSLSLD